MAVWTKPQKELIVEAELLDTGLSVPSPGDEYLISIMRYEVLNVLEGSYTHPQIFVGHDEPDLTSPQFRVGARHRLHLTRDFPEYAGTLNKFGVEARKVGIYFCLSFDVINAR